MSITKLFQLLNLPAELTVLHPQDALRAVLSPNGNEIYASADKLYRNAFFGRDSLTVAEDLLELDPELSQKILLRNASLQGFRFDRQSEEEPGKIAHEHRAKPHDETSLLIYEELVKRWGSYNGDMTYYGSVDATPLFIKVLSEFVNHNGLSILKEEVHLRNGQTQTLDEVFNNALQWLIGRLHASSSGLLEFKATNPKGIENQAWKDSLEFYVHEDGSLVNHTQPVASIEVQGLAYDALLAAVQLKPEEKPVLTELATKLRDLTLDLLWLEDRHYFALGIDRDNRGDLRQIKTKTANPAGLLNSGLFEDLPDRDRQKYVSAIIQTIMGHEFLTDAGIRSRALSAAKLTPFWSYHGSHTTWPKETKEIAKGLYKQGFELLAGQLLNRLLNAVTRVSSYPELIYVDDNGTMLTDVQHTREHEGLKIIEATNKPETLQAWTITAVIWTLRDLYGPQKASQPQKAWQHQLEWDVLDKLPVIGHIKRKEDLLQLYPELKGALVTPRFKQRKEFYSPQLAAALRT